MTVEPIMNYYYDYVLGVLTDWTMLDCMCSSLGQLVLTVSRLNHGV